MSDILAEIFGTLVMYSPAVGFVGTLIPAILFFRKSKKKKTSKAPAIVFTMLAAHFLLCGIVEIALIIWLSTAVRFM